VGPPRKKHRNFFVPGDLPPGPSRPLQDSAPCSSEKSSLSHGFLFVVESHLLKFQMIRKDQDRAFAGYPRGTRKNLKKTILKAGC